MEMDLKMDKKKRTLKELIASRRFEFLITERRNKKIKNNSYYSTKFFGRRFRACSINYDYCRLKMFFFYFSFSEPLHLLIVEIHLFF